MWAARLLLLAVGAAAFHLQESTPVPEPTLSGVNEATSIIPVEPQSEPEEEEVRALKLAMLEEWLRKAFFDLSYTDVKSESFFHSSVFNLFSNCRIHSRRDHRLLRELELQRRAAPSEGRHRASAGGRYRRGGTLKRCK